MSDKICKTLKKINNSEEYELLKQEYMFGLFLMVFVRKELTKKITNVQTTNIKAGFGGILGNKGSLLCRFDLQNTSYLFACCHLNSGHMNNADRVKNLKIMQDFMFAEGRNEYIIKNHDIKIFFGDLNFRLDKDYESVIEDIKRIKTDQDRQIFIENYLPYDQLLIQQTENAWMDELKEMEITFMPTYRLKLGENDYENEKSQTPSWCDRILYNHKQTSKFALNPLEYHSREIYESDHKPVVAFFTAKNEATEET